MPSNEASPRPRRRKALLGGVAVGVVALIAWLLLSKSPDKPEAPRAAPDKPQASWSPGPSSPPPTAPPQAPAPQAPPAPNAPIVDEVLVEKKEVCSGEENLIIVHAHTPDGTDAHLHYSMGGAGNGDRVPLRIFLNPDGTYELPAVTVFGKDNVSTTVPLPHFTVKPCQPERMAQIIARTVPNSPDEYEFMVRIGELPRPDGQPAPPFVPVRYEWTFNDRETKTTTAPVVAHSFESEPHDRLYLQHRVRVDVFDAAGQKVTARHSLQVLSSSFENLDKKGVVTVLAVGTPRFPELGDDGVVRQTFRLFHHFRGIVRIQKVTAIRAFAPVDGPPPPEQADPAALSVDAVPEGRGTEVKVTLDTKKEPDVVSVTYALEGVSADGRPARGTFSVMKPPPRPTRESNVPVTDPILLAKIKKARELLKQPYVTDEDIWRLEREGKFADLKLDGGHGGR